MLVVIVGLMLTSSMLQESALIQSMKTVDHAIQCAYGVERLRVQGSGSVKRTRWPKIMETKPKPRRRGDAAKRASRGTSRAAGSHRVGRHARPDDDAQLVRRRPRHGAQDADGGSAQRRRAGRLRIWTASSDCSCASILLIARAMAPMLIGAMLIAVRHQPDAGRPVLQHRSAFSPTLARSIPPRA